MTTSPRSPNRAEPRGRWRLRAAALVALGGALYYGLDAADRAVIGGFEQAAGEPGEAPLIELPPQLAAEPEGPEPRDPSIADGPGNRVLRSATI